jgi:hypothetical protein
MFHRFCSGGTLDISIIKTSPEKDEVLGTDGNNFLGGENIDEVIADWILQEHAKLSHSAVLKDAKSKTMARKAAKKAKEALSKKMSCEIKNVRFPGGSKPFKKKLTREKFELLCENLIWSKIPPVIDGAMRKAEGISGECDIDLVIMVGGSTRIIKVQEMLRERFDGTSSVEETTKVRFVGNPDEAVAKGAAIHAFKLANKEALAQMLTDAKETRNQLQNSIELAKEDLERSKDAHAADSSAVKDASAELDRLLAKRAPESPATRVAATKLQTAQNNLEKAKKSNGADSSAVQAAKQKVEAVKQELSKLQEPAQPAPVDGFLVKMAFAWQGEDPEAKKTRLREQEQAKEMITKAEEEQRRAEKEANDEFLLERAKEVSEAEDAQRLAEKIDQETHDAMIRATKESTRRLQRDVADTARALRQQEDNLEEAKKNNANFNPPSKIVTKKFVDVVTHSLGLSVFNPACGSQGMNSDQLSESQERVKNAGGCFNCPLRFSLKWESYSDLDLHVTTPSGDKIYFGKKKSPCGGELDVDQNVQPSTKKPIENVVWKVPVDGDYKVQVHLHNDRDGGKEIPFELEIEEYGEKYIHSGIIKGPCSNGSPRRWKDVSIFKSDSSTKCLINDPLILLNSKLPVTHTKEYSTSFDNQESVRIQVLEGDERFASHEGNTEIMAFSVNGIPKAKAGGAKIEVTFSMDEGGMLHVNAKDVKSGNEGSAKLSIKTGEVDTDTQASLRVQLDKQQQQHDEAEHDDADHGEAGGQEEVNRDEL